MKVKCRKCGMIWETEYLTFGDIEEIQKMLCGVHGEHRVVGCK